MDHDTDRSDRAPASIRVAGWWVVGAFALLLSAVNLVFGDLNQDEGWYLYASKLVSEGKLPFLDFAFTQGPVMPLIYRFAVPLVNRWGVAGGRLFTACLGLACIACVACVAGRLAVPGRKQQAALMASALVGVNVYQSYFFTIVKTYSLSGLLIMMSFVLLAGRKGSPSRWASVFAGSGMALASGVRISAAVLIPVVFVYLLVDARGGRENSDRRPAGIVTMGSAACFVLGAALAGGLWAIPFMREAPEGFWFGLLDYHTARTPGSWRSLILYKAGFTSRLVQAYFVPFALFVVAVLYRVTRAANGEHSGTRGPERVVCGVEVVLWVGALAVSVVHFLAPFPYDDYQVMIFPVAAVALSVMLVRLPDRERVVNRLVVTVVILSVAASLSSPINQEWFVAGRDRIWWPVKTETSLGRLRRAAGLVRGMAGEDRLLLTQDAYLAVESGLSLPAGLEMGPFSYFPDWSEARAAQLHVLNRAMMERLIGTTRARVAALSGWCFAIQSPQVIELPAGERGRLWAAVNRRYGPVTEIAGFGQAATTLKIMALHADAGSEGALNRTENQGERR